MLHTLSMNGRKTYLEEISGGHKGHERLDEFTKCILVIGGSVTSNLREPLKDSHHAWPVLRYESPSLGLDLLIVNSPREDGRDDDANDRKEKIVIAPKGIGVVDVCVS